jgi:tetratricopeptide (TPR) repeat protein
MVLFGLRGRFGLALFAASLAAHDVRADCEPWPGEPSPLPTASSGDDLAARFARLRAEELAALAQDLEPSARGDAYRVWLHVACLDPGRTDAREGAKRTSPVRVHTPEAVHRPDAVAAAAPDVASALGRLDDPISVVSATRAAEPAAKTIAPAQRVALSPRAARPRPQTAREESPLAADGLLDEAEALVRQAHFEEALEKAMKAREAVPRTGDEPALRQRRARADVIAGTAQVALGKDADARASFERAIEADPSLRLDRASTSPKVVRAFDAARAAAGTAP